MCHAELANPPSPPLGSLPRQELPPIACSRYIFAPCLAFLCNGPPVHLPYRSAVSQSWPICSQLLLFTSLFLFSEPFGYTQELTLQGIKQFYVALEDERFKLDTLCDLYDTISVAQSIIFCNTRRSVEWLGQEMERRDFTVSVIHSEMGQRERDLVMRAFRGTFHRACPVDDSIEPIETLSKHRALYRAHRPSKDPIEHPHPTISPRCSPRC